MIFDAAFVKQGFKTENLFDNETSIVPATYFQDTNRTGSDYENKVVVGIFLSFTAPDKDGRYYGFDMRMNTMAIQRGAKKFKPTSNHASYAHIMICADVYNLPNCFAVLLKRKIDFQKLFTFASLAEEVSVGDPLAFYEPKPSGDILGENMPILVDCQAVCGLNWNPQWPTQSLIQSSEANQQVAFFMRQQTIRISLASLKCGKENIRCNNITCDQQNRKCPGCFGKNSNISPLVLRCDITVENAPSYGHPSGTAIFHAFTSSRFTRLFFDNLDSLSAKPQEVLSTLFKTVRTSTTAMVNHINNNGGWTVCGWHRMGIFRDEDGDYTFSKSTLGHIILLTPSTPNVITTREYEALKIKTPDANADVAPAANNVAANRGANVAR